MKTIENIIVFLLQLIGFMGIAYGLVQSLRELMHGRFVYRTRLLLFIMLLVSTTACIVPAARALCFFLPDCDTNFNLSIVRYGVATILAVHGVLWVIIYRTKDTDL